MPFVLALTTVEKKSTAKNIAEELVRSKLAACVNIFPHGLSVFHWEGKIQSEEEHVLLIKTHSDQFDQLQQMINQLHPYELPELIAVPITDGSKAYLEWLGQNLNAPNQ